MANCPFCGAVKYADPSITYGKFRCGTLDNDQLPRLHECWRGWAIKNNQELQIKLEELDNLKKLIKELGAPLIKLITEQQYFESHTENPGRMPGNKFYSAKFMTVVNAAKAILSRPDIQAIIKDT